MNVAFRLILLFLFLSVTGQTWGISVTQHQYNSEDIAFGADEYVYDATINLLVCCDNQSVVPQSHDAQDRYSLALIGDFLATKGGTETVQRAMSRAELESIKKSGILSRGGRSGDHFVSDAVNSNANRARQSNRSFQGVLSFLKHTLYPAPVIHLPEQILWLLAATPSEWEQLIEAQQASGLSQKAFCAQNQLSVATFGYWKRKLRQDSHAQSQRDDRHSSADAWLELPVSVPGKEGSHRWQIELDLGQGICLRLKSGS